MPAANTITSVAALALIEAVRRHGQPVEPLIERAGLDPAALPTVEHHVAAETYFDLWDRATRLVQGSAVPRARWRQLRARGAGGVRLPRHELRDAA